MAAALPLALLCAVLAAQDPVADEWRARAWALDPAAHRAAIERALADERWETRHAALDALARAGQGVVWDGAHELLAPRRADPHPNVRRQALRATRRLGAPVAAEELAPLARDPFGGVRLELCEALAGLPEERAAELLLELAADADARVRARAFDLLIGRGPDALGAELDLWERAGCDEEPERFLRALDLLRRAPPNELLIESMRLRWRALERGGAPPARLAALRAAWEALAFVQLGRGQVAPLAAGWLATFEDGDESLDRRRRAQLLAGAAAAGPDLGDLLHAAARAETSLAAGTDLLEGALEALAGDEERLLLVPVGGELDLELWGLLAGRRDAWDAAVVGPWLAPGIDPGVRLAVVNALAETLARSGDEGSALLLARALDDPDQNVAAEAWRALCDAPRPVALAELWRYWCERTGRDVELLRFLSRQSAPAPFRADLIELWASGAARRASVLELLASFRGDGDLARRVEAWLGEELAGLVAAPPPADGAEPDEAWLRQEDRAKALVGALHSIAGEGALESMERVLELSDGLSHEVSKTCAWALGQTPAGRRRLRAWLRPEASMRVRIEAALWIVPDDPDPEVVGLLLERYARCDEELRLRILRVLAPTGDARALAHLAATVTGAGTSPAERVVALAEVARAPRAAGALLAIVAAAPDVDVERAAIEQLGGLELLEPADGERLALLLRERLADPARAEQLRDEVLPALARLAPELGAVELERELLREPLRRAAGELASRFRGERLPAREFVYRGELRAIEELARQGRLEAALAGAGPCWRLDARLLLQLGERALEGGGPGARRAARRLLRAALVAFEGEAPMEDLEHLLCTARARLFALALDERRLDDALLWAGELLDAWRAGRTSERAWSAVFGAVDAADWLEATRLQARAWAALARGDRSGARACWIAAEPLVARAPRAGAEQTRLGRAIE